MTSTYSLEWSFTPEDFFECEFDVIRDDYRLSIKQGKATALVEHKLYDSNPELRIEIEASLKDRFKGAQLVSHQIYELAGPTRVLTHPDGRRDIFVELRGNVIAVTGGTLDVQITSPNGEVIHDSKKERASRKKSLGELIAKHRKCDQYLQTMLTSYDSAIRDPQNELVHLYEIRESLVLRFGSMKNTFSSIGALSSAWSRLGKLCNDEPLRQGRHRGKAGTLLRDATEAELSEARAICIDLLNLYLLYLDANTVSST